MRADMRRCAPGYIQIFGTAYSIGFVLLRRQLAQERLGWNNVPRSPLATAPLTTHRSSAESSRNRRWIVNVVSVGDVGGADELEEEDDLEEAASRDGLAPEMREVHVMPVSLSSPGRAM
ncbi:hypothetical protein NUW54_g2038 [Trametes sanguinea]|uniref:Uncharacterized protein n=1 Tax=Trametes sanguinea TaxID=158606 RepID=A0ACC1Q7B6_9APHY|nr:hypothetical protein NUW54_g2038 [Trametes sanguinea]